MKLSVILIVLYLGYQDLRYGISGNILTKMADFSKFTRPDTFKYYFYKKFGGKFYEVFH